MPPAADRADVDATPRPTPFRRIGTILVEKGLITERQLDIALVEQRETERPLGEICVERFGLDRLSLADALAEQWEEMQQHPAGTGEMPPDDPEVAVASDTAVVPSAEDDLRSLLDEAEAARAELTAKTEELGRRLAALEVLVVGVTDALKELHTPAIDPAAALATGARRPQRARRAETRAAS